MTQGNVVGGHKANINNPNTSEESKQHSKDVLENELNGGDVGQGQDEGAKNPNNVAGGLKATINNPNVSDEAKQNAKERLNES
nr:conidiation-specific protein 6 [Quercus suber]